MHHSKLSLHTTGYLKISQKYYKKVLFPKCLSTIFKMEKFAEKNICGNLIKMPTGFFYKQHFYKQHQTEIGKISSKS